MGCVGPPSCEHPGAAVGISQERVKVLYFTEASHMACAASTNAKQTLGTGTLSSGTGHLMRGF